MGRLRLRQLIADDAHDDVVAHEVASLHRRLGLEADGRAPLHRIAEQVAGGELGKPKHLGEEGALRALAGPGWAHEEDIH